MTARASFADGSTPVRRQQLTQVSEQGQSEEGPFTAGYDGGKAVLGSKNSLGCVDMLSLGSHVREPRIRPLQQMCRRANGTSSDIDEHDRLAISQPSF